MRTVGEAPHWLHSVPCKGALCLHALAAIWVADACGTLLAHGLEEVGGASHVFQVWKRLEDFHHLAHERPSLGIPAKASMCQLSRLLSAFYGEISL